MKNRDYQVLIEQSLLYKEILENNRTNLRSMFLSFYSFALLFSGVFFFVHDYSGSKEFNLKDMVHLSIVLMLVVYSIVRKKDKLVIFIILIMDLYFLIFSLRLPQNMYIEVILISIFPIISYQYFKIKYAIIVNWSFFLTCVLIFYPLNVSLGFRPAEGTYFFVLLGTFILVSIISFYSSMEHRSHNRNLIRGMFFDKLTSLPDWNLLKLRLESESAGFLCLFRISNYNEIQKSLGDELSNRIILLIKDKILSEPACLGLEIFKLRGKDFVFLWDNFFTMNIVRNQVDQIMKVFDLFSIRLDNNVVYIKTTAGVAPVNGEIDDAVYLAESALDKAEMNQLSHFIISEAQLYNSKNEFTDSFQKLIDSMENDRVELHYQPIVDIQTGVILKVEALVRFTDSQNNHLPITPLLKSAYLTGMNYRLTNTILRKASEWAIENQCHISVNIAFEDLMNQNVIDTIDLVLKNLEDNKLELTLEILESSELFDWEKALLNLHKLRLSGARLAIDDFGAGYANLDRILKLHPDIIKFDGSLIRELSFNEDARFLVRMVSDMAIKNGILTVAEQVENKDILEQVKKYGIDQGQGYLFGKPSALIGNTKNSINVL